MCDSLIRSYRRVAYVSSKDRWAGTQNDFVVDLNRSLIDLIDTRNSIQPADVWLSLSVSQLYVPFAVKSEGRAPRYPPTYSTNSGCPPPIRLLRLHTDISVENSSGLKPSDTVLQLPFVDHYREGFPDQNADARSSFSFECAHETHLGKFLVMGGVYDLSSARFWITDEEDRLIVPAGDIYMSIEVTAETNFRERENRILAATAAKDTSAMLDVMRTLLLHASTNGGHGTKGLLGAGGVYPDLLGNPDEPFYDENGMVERGV